MNKIVSEIMKVAGALESTLDGLSNAKARKVVSDLVGRVTNGLFHDEAWVPVSNMVKAFDSMGWDWEQVGASRYWASEEWQRILKENGGKNSPNDHKEWKYVVRFVNDKQRPTEISVMVRANATGRIGAGRDVWETYDMDMGVY